MDAEPHLRAVTFLETQMDLKVCPHPGFTWTLRFRRVGVEPLSECKKPPRTTSSRSSVVIIRAPRQTALIIKQFAGLRLSSSEFKLLKIQWNLLWFSLNVLKRLDASL